MKNNIELIRIVVFIVVFGFSFIACNDDSSDDGIIGGNALTGSTYSGLIFGIYPVSITFTNSYNYEIRETSQIEERGNYTVSGTNVTFNPTWEIEGDLEPFTGVLSNNNNILTITGNSGFSATLTRQ